MNEPFDAIQEIGVLKRRIADLETVSNDTAGTVQQIEETVSVPQQYASQNFLRNADFDLSYDYYVNTVDSGDADTREELFAWYTTEPDTCVESVGAITSGTASLTITTPDFVVGDNGVEIVVEGAGAAGADLVTTISGAPGSTTTATLAVNAGTTVTAARVRWRLMQILEDSKAGNVDANAATDNAIKNSAHTLYGTTINDPDWNKGDGYLRVGSDNWICHPLKQNLIRASLEYISSFNFKLANTLDGAASKLIRPFIGIWDNSAGQRKFLEGDTIALNAEVIGSPSVTTSRTYFAVFYTGWGETIGTQQVTVNAPTTFTNTEYVSLSWTQPAGIVKTEIYRKTGGTYAKLLNPYPQTSYYDKGATDGSTVSAFPTVDRTRTRAYFEFNEFNIPTANTTAWQFAQANLVVPPSYNASKTTDKQWFVMGLATSLNKADADASVVIDDITYSVRGTSGGKNYYDAIGAADSTTLNAVVWAGGAWHLKNAVGTDTDTSASAVTYPWLATWGTVTATKENTDRVVYIDRVSLDDKVGLFARSPWDFSDAKRGLSTSPTSGDMGPVGSGGGGVIDPGGGGYCPTFEMPVEVERDGKRFEISAIDLVDNEHIYKVVNRNNEAVSYTATVSAEPQVVWRMFAEGAYLSASWNEPVFTGAVDTKLLSELTTSDKVMRKGALVQVASNLRQIRKRHTVRIALNGVEKGYYCNGFEVHNRKQDLDPAAV